PDRHVESGATPRYAASDVAHPQDADALARDHWRVVAELVSPEALLDPPVETGDVADGGGEQSESVIGNAIRVCASRACHGNSAFSRRRHVDEFVSCTDGADEFERRQQFHLLRRDTD